MLRYLRAVAAAALLLLLLGAVPVALAASVGDPRTGLSDLAAGDLSDTAILAALVSTAWFTWAYFAGTVIIEAFSLMTSRRRPSRSRPRTAPRPRLAHTLLTAAFVALPLAGPAQALAAVHTPPPGVSTPTVPASTGRFAPSLSSTAEAISARNAGPTASPHADPTPSDEPTPAREYVIARTGPGSFWALAQTYLGDGQRWPEIWRLNQNRRQADGTRLRTPGLLQVGWTVLLPSATNEPVSANPTTATKMRPSRPSREPEYGGHLVYVVRGGDQLGAIAERFLGDVGRYGDIRAVNADLMPTAYGPRGADHLQIGWHLTLPRAARDRGPIRHAAGLVHLQKAPGSVGEPPSPAPSGPADPPSSPSPPDVSGPASTPSAIPTAPQFSAPSGVSSRAQTRPGITVPGGWMDLPLAAAIVAAAGALLVRRRMTHLYPPFDDTTDTDSDLPVFPAVITQLRRAVRQHAADLPPALHDPVRPGRRTTIDPAATGVGVPVHLRGLGLSGAGAERALRGLLAASLSPMPAGSHSGCPVIITHRVLGSLLPAWRPTDSFGGRLVVASDLTDALNHAEAVAGHDEHDGYPRQAGEALSPEPERFSGWSTGQAPGLVLICELPEQPLERARLTRFARSNTNKKIRILVLGPWLPGTSVTVDEDGYLEDPVPENYPAQVTVLDEKATTDVLHVLDGASPQSRSSTSAAIREKESQFVPAEPAEPVVADQNGAPAADRSPSGRQEGHYPGNNDGHAPDPPPRVQVRLLGKPTIYALTGEPVSGLRRHATELLVYLAVHRSGADLPEIMEALWPEATLRRAGQRLSTEVSNLRRNIRIAADDPSLMPVINTGGRYHLDPNLLDIDVWRLLDHLAAASTTTDTNRQRTELQEAINDLDGPLAAGCDYDWITHPREHLRHQAVRAYLALASHPDTTPSEIASLTTRAADLDTASEDVAQRNMRALATVGDAVGVHFRLAELRDALAAIGEQPSHGTTHLADEHTLPSLQERR